MTPTEALIAAVAEGLHRSQGPLRNGRDTCVCKSDAQRIVAALTPEARDAMLLGFAVAALERLLPPGAWWEAGKAKGGYFVSLRSDDNLLWSNHSGPTPLAALLAAQKGLDDD